MRKTMLCVGLAAAFAFAGTGELAGQACLANTASDGQAFLQGGAGFTDGGWALTGTVGGNLRGPVSLAGGVSHFMLDNTDAAFTAVGGTAVVEIENLDFSLCPAVSLTYQWLSNDAGFEEVDADGVVFGGGLGIGKEFPAGESLTVTPHGSASVVHSRSSGSVGGFEATDSETFGSFDAGLVLGGDVVYFGPSVSITTQEGADPVFGVALGFVI